MKIDEIIDNDKNYYMNTFGNRTPVCFTHGLGMKLWDTEGKEYTDFLAGLAVTALGHSHPKLVTAIKTQAEKLIHCTNLYYIQAQTKLAEILVKNSCADKVFFSNSGAEANEGAMKLAKIYFYKKGMHEKYEIITLQNSFHGRTLATVAATGQEKYQKPYQPLIPGIKHVPMNDLKALEATVTDKTCAIMLEPIQGESGVNPIDLEYLKGVRKICNDNGILLIFDEIQCGLGRTGKLFAYENYGVEPDIFTLAKALGGGFPIGAICAKDVVAAAFEPGDHGSTFGGNPLGCSAALAVMDCLINDGIVENAAEMGKYFFDKLYELKSKNTCITEIRGTGLMIGIEFSCQCAVNIKNWLFKKGYLVGSVGTSVVRLLPPLVITKEDIDCFINAFEEVFNEAKCKQ